MIKKSLMDVLLWVMLIALGMAVGYAIGASWHSAPPFEPRPAQETVRYTEGNYDW